MRPHRSLVVGLAKLVQRTGVFADVERAVPSLYRSDGQGKVQEAVLDVVISPPASFSTFMADITVRCPHSVRYKETASIPASAADDGELEKYERYGSAVTPISFETYGRMGVRSQAGLMSIAAVAAGRSHREIAAAALYANWRLELERILLFEQADITLLSYGTSSGFHSLRGKRRTSELREGG